MALEGAYEPSPSDYVAEQVRVYEATGGVEGGELQGAPCVILTSRGRKSGKLRKTPLIRVEHDGEYAVLASMGGAPKNPFWYHNLLGNPEVELQDGPTVHQLRARELSGEERATWWARSTDVWPAYDEYQDKTDRLIPVFVLEE